MMLEGFQHKTCDLNGIKIAYSELGKGKRKGPILLLHGFPQNRFMWYRIALILANYFHVICADLRGYGDSSKPKGVSEYSFRKMGGDQLNLMTALGFDRFHLIGHDRGARTAHRMALDATNRIKSLTVMDITPTHFFLDELTSEVARAYYHWFFLAQPSPFPETLISTDADYFFESCLLGWGGSKLQLFDQRALKAYRKAWRNPATIEAMCNDYRAALECDFSLDERDLFRKLDLPALVMWGAGGVMDQSFDLPETWRSRLTNFKCHSIPGGHFFPEMHPKATASALLGFIKRIGDC